VYIFIYIYTHTQLLHVITGTLYITDCVLMLFMYIGLRVAGG